MRRPGRVALALGVLLLVALAVGAAASLVTGAATAPVFHAPAGTELFLGPGVVAIGAIAVVGLVFGSWFLLAGSGRSFTGRLALFGLVTVLVMIVALLLLESVGAGMAPTTGTPGNSTTAPQNATGPVANSTPGSGYAQPLFFNLSLPAGFWFAMLAVGAGIAVVAVGLSAVRIRRGPPPAAPPAETAAEVRRALGAAAEELTAGDDPRAVVIRLYGAILQRVGAMVGDLEGATPEEIRAQHLVRLGVRPAAALTLTRLFEEARYSSHPMGSDRVAAARIAIRDGLDDLDRRAAGA
jgi:hypothetical protein